MKTQLNNQLTVLEIERDQNEQKLRDQIRSIRSRLDNLERKLDNKEDLYDADGLQGNGNSVDMYLAKVVTYGYAIERFKKLFDKQ